MDTAGVDGWLAFGRAGPELVSAGGVGDVEGLLRIAGTTAGWVSEHGLMEGVTTMSVSMEYSMSRGDIFLEWHVQELLLF